MTTWAFRNPYTGAVGGSPWGGNEQTGYAPPANSFGNSLFPASSGRSTTNNYFGWGSGNQTGFAPTFQGVGGGAAPQTPGLGGQAFNAIGNRLNSIAGNWQNEAKKNFHSLDEGRMRAQMQESADNLNRSYQRQAGFDQMWGQQANGGMLVPNPQGGLMLSRNPAPAGSAMATQLPSTQTGQLKPGRQWGALR